jgi:hypothetical protein
MIIHLPYRMVVIISYVPTSEFSEHELAMIIQLIVPRSAFDPLLVLLTYQLLTVGYLPTVALTGGGGLGFDSGEGARETATTSKECSRHANYPILMQGGSDNK